MERNQIIQIIRSAWHDVEYSAEVDAALRTWSPHPEDREAQSAFVGKTWEEIPESVLTANCPSPFFIGDIPMQYYLPAFLITAIREPSGDLLDFLINFHRKPPKKPRKFEVFCQQFARLTNRQRSAVAAL